jgi:hypothetical protein
MYVMLTCSPPVSFSADVVMFIRTVVLRDSIISGAPINPKPRFRYLTQGWARHRSIGPIWHIDLALEDVAAGCDQQTKKHRKPAPVLFSQVPRWFIRLVISVFDGKLSVELAPHTTRQCCLAGIEIYQVRCPILVIPYRGLCCCVSVSSSWEFAF